MDLWIRSQDREKLVKCDDIAIKSYLYNEITKEEYCYKIVGYFDKETEYETLGSYKTKERALKVLDDIQRWISGEITIKKLNQTNGNMDNVFPTIVYDMPEE